MEKKRRRLRMVNIRHLTIAFLIFVLSCLFLSLGIIGIEQHHATEPCVDGDGDVNLEGIMCSKLHTSFFGVSDDDQSLLFTWVLICTFTFMASVLLFLISLGGNDD